MRKFFQISFILSFLLVIVFFGFMTKIKAQSTFSSNAPQLYGMAYSKNVGWISFSDCDFSVNPSCTPTYYVQADPSTGILDGSAWAPNIGFIYFKSSFHGPFGLSGGGMPATIDASGNLTGWARASAFPFTSSTYNADNEATINGTTTTPAEWADGWINFSGSTTTGYPYKVSFDNTTKKASGFAWGDKVLGWISMSGANYGVYVTSTNFAPTASLNITVNGQNTSTMYQGQEAVVTWDSTNATSCTRNTDSNVSSWDGNNSTAASNLSGISTGTSLAVGTYTFKILSCNGSGGASTTVVSKTLTVQALPACTIPPSHRCTSAANYGACITCSSSTTQTYNPTTCVCDTNGNGPIPGTSKSKIPVVIEN